MTTGSRSRRAFLRAAGLLTLPVAPCHAIVGGIATTQFKAVANGVQFTPNWVLTARHVGGCTVGASFGNGYGSATIAARHEMPGAGHPQNDLALLRLATPIEAPLMVLEATVLPPGDRVPPIAATIVTGRNQVPRGYAHTYVQTVLASVDPDGPGPRPAVPVNWLVTRGPGGDGAYVEGNDSGGALFIGHVADETPPLWGITSAAMTFGTAAQPLRMSAFVQIAAYRDWIDATMAADTFDDQTALWLETLP